MLARIQQNNHLSLISRFSSGNLSRIPDFEGGDADKNMKK